MQGLFSRDARHVVILYTYLSPKGEANKSVMAVPMLSISPVPTCVFIDNTFQLISLAKL